MDWKSSIRGFYQYLLLEQGLAKNTLSSYTSDLEFFAEFCQNRENQLAVNEVDTAHIEEFLSFLYDKNIQSSSQARYLSSLKAFFRYAMLENIVQKDPVDILQGPKLERKLPEILSVDEVNQLMDSMDLSQTFATRNRALLETLYACGLRVSELCNLQLSNLHAEVELIKVHGKGNKERWVPISNLALTHLNNYIQYERRTGKIVDEDIIFLNNRGKKLTRQSVFLILKKACQQAGINKKVSPHTLRHSFATHLLKGGADLKAIQSMLGHESITTTEIYTHIDQDYLREAILKFHPRNKD
nr:site-specific tyrosine recombinase XerD [Saprospiraceae bacterium]